MKTIKKKYFINLVLLILFSTIVYAPCPNSDACTDSLREQWAQDNPSELHKINNEQQLQQIWNVLDNEKRLKAIEQDLNLIYRLDKEQRIEVIRDNKDLAKKLANETEEFETEVWEHLPNHERWDIYSHNPEIFNDLSDPYQRDIILNSNFNNIDDGFKETFMQDIRNYVLRSDNYDNTFSDLNENSNNPELWNAIDKSFQDGTYSLSENTDFTKSFFRENNGLELTDDFLQIENLKYFEDDNGKKVFSDSEEKNERTFFTEILDGASLALNENGQIEVINGNMKTTLTPASRDEIDIQRENYNSQIQADRDRIELWLPEKEDLEERIRNLEESIRLSTSQVGGASLLQRLAELQARLDQVNGIIGTFESRIEDNENRRDSLGMPQQTITQEQLPPAEQTPATTGGQAAEEPATTGEPVTAEPEATGGTGTAEELGTGGTGTPSEPQPTNQERLEYFRQPAPGDNVARIDRIISGIEDNRIFMDETRNTIENLKNQYFGLGSILNQRQIEILEESLRTLERTTRDLEQSVNELRELERIEEAERRAREEADRIAREEADRIAREEADRIAREEADRIAREEADRIAREEADRIAREEADREARQQSDGENGVADGEDYLANLREQYGTPGPDFTSFTQDSNGNMFFTGNANMEMNNFKISTNDGEIFYIVSDENGQTKFIATNAFGVYNVPTISGSNEIRVDGDFEVSGFDTDRNFYVTEALIRKGAYKDNFIGIEIARSDSGEPTHIAFSNGIPEIITIPEEVESGIGPYQIESSEGPYQNNLLNFYAHHVKGPAQININQGQTGSPLTAAAIYNNNDNIGILSTNVYIANITLKSKKSQYFYRIENYSVKSSLYGDFKDKTICFRNCNPHGGTNNKVNIYLRDDNEGIISLGMLENAVVDYQGNKREVFDKNNVMFQKFKFNNLNDHNSVFKSDDKRSISDDQNLLTRLNIESKADLSSIETLERKGELYYQNAEPASFSNLKDKVSFFNKEFNEIGFTEINFFSYIRNDKRILVLNRYTYNNIIEMEVSNKYDVDVPTMTFVDIDGDISYSIESDLSMSPEVYGVNIYFLSPDDTIYKYGEIVSG